MVVALEREIREHLAAEGKLCPWAANPYALVSWWDMRAFPIQSFLIFARQFQQMASESSQREDSVAGEGQRRRDIEALTDFAVQADEYSLTLTSDQFMRMVRASEKGASEKELAAMLPELLNRLEDECSRRKMMMIDPARVGFYDRNELFGTEVNAKFPATQYDMVEAGNCLALGRGTACVFHLMRIMEVGVQELGKKLGITLVTDKNWQNILDEITKAIKALPPKAPATILMNQASANLYSVKLAWRNEVMHPKDTYTLEEAENLIGQVKLFMAQLASII